MEGLSLQSDAPPSSSYYGGGSYTSSHSNPVAHRSAALSHVRADSVSSGFGVPRHRSSAPSPSPYPDQRDPYSGYSSYPAGGTTYDTSVSQARNAPALLNANPPHSSSTTSGYSSSAGYDTSMQVASVSRSTPPPSYSGSTRNATWTTSEAPQQRPTGRSRDA